MSQFRQPTGYLTIDGTRFPFIECEVEQHKLATSDSFHAQLALTPEHGADYWNGLTQADAEVFFALGPGQGVSLLKASLESVSVKYLTQTVEISGKDKTKDLVDTRSNKGFRNKSAKEIVDEIAKAHGLTVVSSATPDLSGKIYQIDHNRLMDQESDWSLIQRLARLEGFDAWVKGSTLYFKDADDENDPALTVTYTPPTDATFASGNFIDLTITRSLSLSKSVSVKAASWSMKQKKALSHEETIAGNAAGTLRYHLRGAGQSQAQLEKRAKKHAKQVKRHEIAVTVELPGDPNVSPMMRLVLSGTGADQSYFIDSVSHHMSVGIGYRMTIHAKNKDESGMGKGGAKTTPRPTRAGAAKNLDAGTTSNAGLA